MDDIVGLPSLARGRSVFLGWVTLGELATSNRVAQWAYAQILLSLTFGAITFQQPTVLAVCLDIGGEYAGAVMGAMNTAASAGAFVGSVAFGYLVDRSAGYDAPFIPMVARLVTGACWLWLKVDPSLKLTPRTPEAAEQLIAG